MRPTATFRHVGKLLLIIGCMMLLPGLYAAIIGENTAKSFLGASGITFGLSIALGASPARRTAFREGALQTRAALAVVIVGWFVVTLVAAVPFMLANTFPHWSDALFEAASGFTTTGATALSDVDGQPRSVLLWRSLLQWLGGMGIVVLFLSVFPHFGIGGLALFRAEVPGPEPEKALPRLASTSRLLWLIYILLTGAAYGCLLLAGMPSFDALNYALATVSTGGFATRTDGLGAFGSTGIQEVLAIFMFLGGTNFLLLYRLFRFGQWRAVLDDSEFRLYAGLLATTGCFIALSLWLQGGTSPPDALRHGLFQAISTMTTTGYAAGDYDQWPPLSRSLLFVLLFVGGSAGSTAGGPKVIRILMALKQSFNYLRQLIHPRAVTVVRVGDQAVAERVLAGVAAFLLFYIAVWLLGIVVLGALGMHWEEASAASIAALGNTGTGFSTTGPTNTYAALSPSIKLFLSVVMIIGRLEILSVLVLLHPAFWRGQRRGSD